MINWAILKEPWNWFLVGFTFILVLSISHLFLRNTSTGDNT